MIGKVVLCDSCKKSSENPKVDAWIAVATNGIVKFALSLQTPAHDFKVDKPLDFCSWRCFRKYWKGK